MTGEYTNRSTDATKADDGAVEVPVQSATTMEPTLSSTDNVDDNADKQKEDRRPSLPQDPYLCLIDDDKLDDAEEEPKEGLYYTMDSPAMARKYPHESELYENYSTIQQSLTETTQAAAPSRNKVSREPTYINKKFKR